MDALLSSVSAGMDGLKVDQAGALALATALGAPAATAAHLLMEGARGIREGLADGKDQRPD